MNSMLSDLIQRTSADLGEHAATLRRLRVGVVGGTMFRSCHLWSPCFVRTRQLPASAALIAAAVAGVAGVCFRSEKRKGDVAYVGVAQVITDTYTGRSVREAKDDLRRGSMVQSRIVPLPSTALPASSSIPAAHGHRVVSHDRTVAYRCLRVAFSQLTLNGELLRARR